MARFSSQIPVDPNGYRWVNLGGYEPADGTQLFEESVHLQASLHDEWQMRYRRDHSLVFDENTYDPFIKEPALFRIFAAIELRPEAILEFANRYGDISRLEGILEDGGMTLSWWKNAIESMRRGVELADLAASASHMRSQKKIQDAISSVLDEMLSDLPVYFNTFWQKNQIRLKTMTLCLGDVLKLQLAEAFIDQKQYRDCHQCGKPFELTPQINRSDRVFCSDSCRMKAYYRRKTKAIALREEGRSLREIVNQTGSDLATVKKWLGSAKSKES